MGMYHKNHLVGPGFKRMAKRQTSKGMRRAAKKSCQELFEDSITPVSYTHLKRRNFKSISISGYHHYRRTWTWKDNRHQLYH